MSSADDGPDARSARPLRRAQRVRVGAGAAVVLVVAVAAIAVFLGMVRTSPQPAASIAISPSDVSVPALYVHVSGAVERPGLYRLGDGARVVDVVAAAGGLADDADSSQINLARPLTDGEHLQVPRAGETAAEVPGTRDGRVDLNSADAATLDTLPRIGPAIAERIIAWREENGRFTSVDDLLAVPGIGEKLLAGLRDLVTV